jgi:hypothetical protein
VKRLPFALLGFSLLFLALHLALFVGQLGVPTESSRWVHEALEIKERRARSIEGRKLLLIAGSNTLYSFDAESLGRRLEVPAVNFGVHAGLRLEYILARAEPLVGPGDLVVLPLEYAAYNYDGTTSKVLADFVASRDPAWVRRSASTFLNTAFSFPVVDLAKRNRARFRPEKRRIGHYDASFISEFGDKTNTGAELLTRRHLAERDAQRPLSLRKFAPDSKAARLLDGFIRRCRERGAEVFLSFPVTMDFEDYHRGDFFAHAEERVDYFRAAGAVRLGGPRDFLLPRELFFNSLYHPSADGREIATRRLGDLLESHLADALRPPDSPAAAPHR